MLFCDKRILERSQGRFEERRIFKNFWYILCFIKNKNDIPNKLIIVKKSKRADQIDKIFVKTFLIFWFTSKPSTENECRWFDVNRNIRKVLT